MFNLSDLPSFGKRKQFQLVGYIPLQIFYQITEKTPPDNAGFSAATVVSEGLPDSREPHGPRGFHGVCIGMPRLWQLFGI
ncbi:MAG: hypothetical protein KAJ11_13235 [Alphaproteobacteria bacterium]|nr:hypothetical protein [Alphaproteobacteria bacterium]